MAFFCFVALLSLLCFSVGTPTRRKPFPSSTVSVVAGKAKVSVTWSDIGVSGAIYEIVSRGGNHSDSVVHTASAGGTWDDVPTGIQNGFNYTYYVRTWNAARTDGATGNEADAYVNLDPPNNLIAYKDGSGNVWLSWNAVGYADSYVLNISTASGNHGSGGISTSATSYNAGPDSGSTTRYFAVKSVNAAGESSYGNEAISTGLPPVTARPPYQTACPNFPAKCGSLSPSAGALDAPSGASASPLEGDPVNLATGAENYLPSVDLAVYNPNGMPAIFQRSYRSNLVKTALSSPGLSRGWCHNYDAIIKPYVTTGQWGPLTLVYPSGAQDTYTPTMSGATPTGAFTEPTGVPVIATGVASGTTGVWTSVTLTWSDQTQWRFVSHASGVYVLDRISNRVGQGISLVYDSTRRLTSVKDYSSSTTLMTLTYDANGLINYITDLYSRRVYYRAQGYEATVSGLTGRYLASRSQVVTSSTPASSAPDYCSYGYYAVSQYPNQPFLHTLTKPSPTGSGTTSATVNYGYVTQLADIGVTDIVDPNGNKQVFTYASGYTTIDFKNSGGTTALTLKQTFDSNKRDTGMLDASNYGTTLVYGDSNNPYKATSVIDASGRTTYIAYDSFGNVTSVQTPRPVTTTYSYDYTNFSLGRLTSVQEGSKTPVTISYNEPSGQVNTVTTARPYGGSGTVNTTYTYNSLGDVLTVTEPGNNAVSSKTTTLSYTTDGGYSQSAAVGQPVRVTDNNGNYSSFRYDSQGRNISAKDKLGNETTFTYNIVGQPLQTTLPATGQTGAGHAYSLDSYAYVGGPAAASACYDESGSLKQTVTPSYGPNGEVLGTSGNDDPASVIYDALYRVLQSKDGLNQTTTYTYNSRGLPNTIAYPTSGTVTFNTYNACGDLTQQTDAKGTVKNFVYGDPEGLLTSIQYPSDTSQNVTYAYDGYGTMNSMTDATGVNTYTYGNLDELVTATTTYTGIAAKVMSYTYNPDGSRATMTTPAGSFGYSYDNAGRMVGLTNPYSGENFSWTYLGNDWLDTQTQGNGAYTTYTHNNAGQMTALVNKTSGGTTLSSFGSVSYDGLGNLTGLTSSVPSNTTYGGTSSWTYNARNQMTQEVTARLGGYTHNFAYDNAGNPTTFKGASRTYNDRNQRVGTGYAYDANGNATMNNTFTLTYDLEDRITAYGITLFSGYRGDSLRAWKYNSSGGTSKRYYIYDGTTPVVELDYTGAVSAVNTFGPTGLLARRLSGASTFYTFDIRGATVQRLDSSQAVLTTHTQDAFGNVTSTAAMVDPFVGIGSQFGYYRDFETTMQLLTYRYYDPSIGRFLSRDPSGYGGGMNLYAYVDSNPMSFGDPFGLEKDWLWKFSDFCAGFGDAASFGLTRSIRDINGANSVVDFNSGYYAAGGYTELGLEVALSGGSAILKRKAASVASKSLVRSQAYRMTKALKLAEGVAGDACHSQALFGHPVQIFKKFPPIVRKLYKGAKNQSMFPVGGLPKAIHSGSWNIRFMAQEQHLTSHYWQLAHELEFRALVNPVATSIKSGIFISRK